MRKIRMLVGFLGMLFVLTRDDTNVAKASGATYRYDAVTAEASGETTTRKAWFVDGTEISGNPGVMDLDSQVEINVTPDAECASYLASFDAPTVRVTVNSGVTVTFGSAEAEASMQGLTCNNADVTVYAKAGEPAGENIPSSVYGVTVHNSTLAFNGNIQYLCLGDEFPYSEGESAVNAGTVTVTGNVYSLQWYKTTVAASGTTTYKGFTGSASVSGTVGNFSLMEMLYSNALEAELGAETGNGSWVELFAMTDGALSDATKSKVTFVTPDVESFYYQLLPQGNGGWRKVARYLDGGETNISKTITDTEAKSLLSAGTARVEVVVPDVSADLSAYNLAELKLYRGTVTVGSVSKEDGSGLLQIHSYGSETIDVEVEGNVDKCSISLTRFNQNMGIDVGGTVTEGHIYKASLQTDRSIDLGTFSCTDMWIMKNGIWNPLLFLSLGTAEYHPVDDCVLDDLLGLTKNVVQGAETLSEMADMVVTEMAAGVLDALTSDETFCSAVNEYEGAKVLSGVEIELSKFTYNETTGEVTNQQKVTELAEEKELSFTVKIPDGYKEGKQYIIVREHETEGGTTMEVLKPTRDGDKLTFQTNKFSSFTIVETEADELQKTEGIGAVKSASLKIEDSIAIIYQGAVLTSALGEGEAPTARFTYRNAVTTANGTYLEDVVSPSNGKTYAVYQFECRDILPQYADENVKFELLLNGEVIACLKEYSVKAYCDTMLGKTAADLGISESRAGYFKTLLVDMLYYADAVKSYTNMTQTLTAALTETEKAYHTSGATANAENKLSLTGGQTDPYCFQSATLVLEDRVKVQISFTAEEIAGLSLQVQLGDSTTTYTAADFDSKDGKYIVKFDKINATQYDIPLTASFFKDGIQQTQKLTYSIGTYVNRSLASTPDATLRNALTEMYEFGQAAKNYVNAQ